MLLLTKTHHQRDEDQVIDLLKTGGAHADQVILQVIDLLKTGGAHADQVILHSRQSTIVSTTTNCL